jgi:hypothetical protein
MKFRYARHCRNIQTLSAFYTQVIGLEHIGDFQQHAGYDGVFLGFPGGDWHLEFTQSADAPQQQFDEDDALVFYVHSDIELNAFKRRFQSLQIPIVEPRNPYWKTNGLLIKDTENHPVIIALQPFKLKSDDALTRIANQATWNDLLNAIQQLPYGRNANRHEHSLVLTEQKGTCSSKHALVKQVADLNGVGQVKLILGMYKMNAENTPKINSVIQKAGLDYIPEAHCYLKINNLRIDITTPASRIDTLLVDILEEIEIQPEQVDTFKVAYHQEFMKCWLAKEQIAISFEEVWKIRERCIDQLSK